MENYIIANQTDTGKVRTVNEDSMTTFDSPNGRVVVVCDGMGGQNAGDVASQLAVTVIQDILTDNRFSTPEEAIAKSIIAANQAILMRAGQDMSLSGMGSTCVMLIISEGKVYYGSVGDSRIYYIADGTIRQLTKDQSYVQTLVDAGELTQEAAEHHQDKNQITNALGIEGMTPPVVCQVPITPEPGSVFLLCSDGLSGMLNGSVINQVVSNNTLTLQDKAKELIRLANEAGGIDNITVQLIEFPHAARQNRQGAPIATGNNISKKSAKNRAVLYWIVTIVCLILAIGGVTYWLITKDDADHKPTVTTKTETKNKNTKTTKSTNTSSQPSTSTKNEEQPKVIVIEQKQEKSVKKTQKSNKFNQIEQKAKEEIQNLPEEADNTEPINVVKRNLENEKNN